MQIENPTGCIGGASIWDVLDTRDSFNIPPIAVGINSEANEMSKLQVKMLMRVYGLTESQAQMLATLIWGAGQ
jgi:hypothetical protein